MNADRIRVLIAEDEDLLRASFVMLVDAAPDLDAVGGARTGAEAVQLWRSLRPDVVLMDIRMPELDGVEATRRIRSDPDPAAVVILTTLDHDEHLYGALESGASGFLLKTTSPEALLQGIRTVHAGGTTFSVEITERMVSHRPFRARSGAQTVVETLTDREKEMVAAVGRGKSNDEIAACLYLSSSTVKSYVSRLLSKLGLRDRAQLVVLAYECGLVRPGQSSTLGD